MPWYILRPGRGHSSPTPSRYGSDEDEIFITRFRYGAQTNFPATIVEQIRFLASRFPPNDVVLPPVPLAPLLGRSMEDTAPIGRPVTRPGLVTTDFDNIRLAVHNIASGHATFFARCPHDYSSAVFSIQAVSFDVFRQRPCPDTARGPRTP